MEPTAESQPRVGAVNYLNSKPLIEGLADTNSGISLSLDYPSRLAQQLARDALDVALIPSIEYLVEPAYDVISDACVAARGPVLSVKMYSRVPVRQIRRLALDEGSRTSAALVRILLAERFDVHPHSEPLPLQQVLSASTADALLVIGDRAMLDPREKFMVSWDLAEEWVNWTGLPFVFALWAARRDRLLPGVEQILTEARDQGVARAEAIARREAPRLGISPQLAHNYLTRNLHFTLGERERRGLQRFYELAVQQGLAPEGNELVFRHCTTA